MRRFRASSIILVCGLTALRLLLSFDAVQADFSIDSTGSTSSTLIYLPSIAKPPSLPPNTTFAFEATIPTDQQELIRNSIGMGHDYFISKGGVDSGGTTVFSYSTLDTLVDSYAQWFGIPVSQASQAWSTCGTAIADARVIFLYTSCWWATAPNYARSKVMVHEYFHVLQNEMVYPTNLIGVPDDQVPLGGPRWLIEGSAEYVGWRVIANNGLYNYATAKQEQISQAKLCTTPLASMETWVGGMANACEQSYPVSFVAVDLLVTTSGDSSLIAFYDAIGQGSTWQSAFQAAFGKTIGTFYQQFEEYRNSL